MLLEPCFCQLFCSGTSCSRFCFSPGLASVFCLLLFLDRRELLYDGISKAKKLFVFVGIGLKSERGLVLVGNQKVVVMAWHIIQKFLFKKTKNPLGNLLKF